MLERFLDQAKFSQVGFVVNDLEEAKNKFALLFGCDVPNTCDGGTYEVAQTRIYGQPAPDANCLMAFFDLRPGVQLELIQPNEAPSVWRDHLEKYGEGIHHIAFNTDDADEMARRLCEAFDGEIEQQGNYGDGSGQYIYLSLHKTLKCRVELLESYKK
ncbi:MAG: VOC family protein [Clostridia bacterium]|nr:VOC family protein [Clostridia bacterium]